MVAQHASSVEATLGSNGLRYRPTNEFEKFPAMRLPLTRSFGASSSFYDMFNPTKWSQMKRMARSGYFDMSNY